MAWKIGVNLHNLVRASLAVGLTLGITALAQERRPQAVAVTPSELSWMSQGPLAAPGMEQVNLVGNPHAGELAWQVGETSTPAM
jgi:hypothetical protein